MPARQYSLEKLTIEPLQSRPALWTFARTSVRGTEHLFHVTDGNHRQRNQWEFVVRVPDARDGRVEVRPVRVPNDKAWADLDRRSLTFRRATRPGYTTYRYCPVALARAPGEGTREIAHRGEKTDLPSWFRPLFHLMKMKETVRPTRGTDAKSLVMLVRASDYERMIGLFMATKAWVLKRGAHLKSRAR
jgi:hypothetical protein